jgi:predicted transcriptional regulator
MYEVIASKNRLEIMKILSRQDRYVSEIMELCKMDGKNAKHHLNALEEKGIIYSYTIGRRKYYRLSGEIHLEISPPPGGRFLFYVSIPSNNN